MYLSYVIKKLIFAGPILKLCVHPWAGNSHPNYMHLTECRFSLPAALSQEVCYVLTLNSQYKRSRELIYLLFSLYILAHSLLSIFCGETGWSTSNKHLKTKPHRQCFQICTASTEIIYGIRRLNELELRLNGKYCTISEITTEVSLIRLWISDMMFMFWNWEENENNVEGELRKRFSKYREIKWSEFVPLNVELK